jgi:hypothetical protein
MRRLQAVLLIGAMWLTGCSGLIFFSGAIPPSSTFVTISGIVSVVQITTIITPSGTTTLITVVTFLQFGTGATINFCGNMGSQFVVNSLTTVNFTQGPNCATIVAISTG